MVFPAFYLCASDLIGFEFTSKIESNNENYFSFLADNTLNYISGVHITKQALTYWLYFSTKMLILNDFVLLAR